MDMQENVSLKTYNSFGIDALARFFAAFSNIDELDDLLKNNPAASVMVLGGGSNLLFTKDYDGLVMKNEIAGITTVREDADYVYVKAGAGENWHRFVLYCIERNLGGVENLSLIPGNMGAGPMQNIGAYGVELKDVFHELEAYHLFDRTMVTFGLEDCQFGYRESVFKKHYKGQFAITSVTCKLRKNPVFNTSYGAIRQELEKANIAELSIRAISDAVIRIRTSKLPDPTVIGNAGSFFKNPELAREQWKPLKERFPDMVLFPLEDGAAKLAAGWLIEQCGWKGFRRGDAGVHALQALVLVNYGSATGEEIYALSTEIIQSVRERFGLELEREVNII